MGYCSELDVENGNAERLDPSFPSKIELLELRIDDLLIRLQEIKRGEYGESALERMGCHYTLDEIKHAAPKYYYCEEDVITALAIAKRELQSLTAKEDNHIERNDYEGCLDGQMTLWELQKVETMFYLQNAQIAA